MFSGDGQERNRAGALQSTTPSWPFCFCGFFVGGGGVNFIETNSHIDWDGFELST